MTLHKQVSYPFCEALSDRDCGSSCRVPRSLCSQLGEGCAGGLGFVEPVTDQGCRELETSPAAALCVRQELTRCPGPWGSPVCLGRDSQSLWCLTGQLQDKQLRKQELISLHLAPMPLLNHPSPLHFSLDWSAIQLCGKESKDRGISAEKNLQIQLHSVEKLKFQNTWLPLFFTCTNTSPTRTFSPVLFSVLTSTVTFPEWCWAGSWTGTGKTGTITSNSPWEELTHFVETFHWAERQKSAMTSINTCFIWFQVNVKTGHKSKQATMMDNILHAHCIGCIALPSPCFFRISQVLHYSLFFSVLN